MMPTIDSNLFLVINGFAGKSAILDAFGIFCAKPLVMVMAGAVALRSLTLAWRRSSLAAQSLTGIPRGLLAMSAALSVKYLLAASGWLRLRPYMTLVGAHRIISEPHDAQSFPSGHSSVAFALAFTTLFADPASGRWMMVGATLVALGRVYVGVHYPFDVAAGAAVGFVTAYVVSWVGRRLDDQKLIARIWSTFFPARSLPVDTRYHAPR